MCECPDAAGFRCTGTAGACRPKPRAELPAFQLQAMAVNCHHNDVHKETHAGQEMRVTRKGAVRAGKGELGIIPGSMGAKRFIVRGLGNDDSFHSCSHGAGRVMSRTAARNRITLEQHRAATADVECGKDQAVIDGSPAACKDIDAVTAAQADWWTWCTPCARWCA